MLTKICTFLLFCYLSASGVQSKATLSGAQTDRQTYGFDAVCEDQLLKYRKFMLHALINTADVCSTFDILPSMELSELQSATEQHAELANYLRLLVQHLSDKEINGAIEEAVLENCGQKGAQHAQQQQQQQQQQQVKRELVGLGQKQRFHSWGGKRAENLPTSLYFI